MDYECAFLLIRTSNHHSTFTDVSLYDINNKLVFTYSSPAFISLDELHTVAKSVKITRTCPVSAMKLHAKKHNCLHLSYNNCVSIFYVDSNAMLHEY
jgi:hypothetical protein